MKSYAYLRVLMGFKSVSSFKDDVSDGPDWVLTSLIVSAGCRSNCSTGWKEDSILVWYKSLTNILIKIRRNGSAIDKHFREYTNTQSMYIKIATSVSLKYLHEDFQVLFHCLSRFSIFCQFWVSSNRYTTWHEIFLLVRLEEQIDHNRGHLSRM